jgi:RNA polymerase sigma factor (sigma-70 family)
MHQTRGIAEEDIISQCKQGSLKGQELLYKQFYGYAMGISLRYCLNREDALEVVNDGFIKIFNTIKIYDNARPFKAWMRVIMVNTAIDRRRKDLKFQLNTELDNAIPLSNTPGAIDKLNADDIIGLMKHLPAVQLAIFNLYEIDGYSHDEIAGLLSIPASSSRVYLGRAKEKLRNLITAESQKYGRSAG